VAEESEAFVSSEMGSDDAERVKEAAVERAVLTAVHQETLRYLEFCRRELGLRPEEMRVLDYGCGNGDAVLALRQLGYQAFGADIDADAIASGRAKLDAAGLAGEGILAVVGDDGRMPFDDGFIHFVCSQQVFEHVVDLDIVARELHRVTAPEGYGFHVFPPRRRPQEVHYRMPFVHWLPKNRLRKAAILGYAAFGFGLRPPEIPGAGPRERAEFLYRYSVNQTFYRRHGDVAATLQAAGLDVCFVVTNHRRFRASRTRSRLVDTRLLRRGIDWTLLTFLGVNLLTRRSAESARSDIVSIGDWRDSWRLASPAMKEARPHVGTPSAAGT
jgi:SAM-dependent methyltransferase